MTTVVDSYIQNRPIRPLPKRRLRSRLSEEAQAEIELLAPSPTKPGRVFNLPFGPYSDFSTFNGTPLGMSAGIHTMHGGSQRDSEDEDDDEDYSQPGSGVGGSGMLGGAPEGGHAAVAGGNGPLDTYDWVENTNNKKKRKIPSPVNPGGAAGVINGGLNASSITSHPYGYSPAGPTSTPRSRWKSTSSGQRSPLSGSRDHASIRRISRRYQISPGESRRRLFPPQCSGSEDSQTTALFQNEDTNDTPSKLDLAKPHQSQFTFEHITPASTSLALQAVHPNLAHQPPATRDGCIYPKMSTVGTQTSPSISNSNTYPPAPAPKKKSARNTKVGQQQRQRRQVSGGYGLHSNNNNNGEIWICEFCEYESIFGEPPEALMRQYDLKDRKERRKLREKQRLLDKTKQKGKKNQVKNSTKKSTSAANSSAGSSPPPAPPPSTADSQGSHSDDTPLASTNVTPSLKPQKHSQVQTEILDSDNHHISSGRGAMGSGVGGKAAATGTAASGGNNSGGQFGSNA